MQLFRRHGLLFRVLCYLIALHLFNFSIDPPDSQPDFVEEDLSINDIESITEFLAEVVFGYTDAFAEHDEADGNNETTVDFGNVFYTAHESAIQLTPGGTPFSVNYFIAGNSNFSVLAREIASPPPEV